MEYDFLIPEVSIICTCYNHERYIRQAIEGFLSQKTLFPFEIIIHDDASTDSSVSIIREYVSKYPNLIIPIYQTENKHSKGIRITKDIMIPQARGKFIAICEGDDFWIDSNKLQMQYDYMINNPKCMLCTHANDVVFEDGLYDDTWRYHNGDYDITLDDWLSGNKYIIQTATFFIRKELYSRFSAANNFCPVGDYSICVEAAMIYPIHYIDRIMSCYRTMSVSSWSREMAIDKSFKLAHYSKMINYFQVLKKIIPEKTCLIENQISVFNAMTLFEKKEYKEFFNTSYYNGFPLYGRMKFRLRAYCPNIHGFLSRIKLNLHKTINRFKVVRDKS